MACSQGMQIMHCMTNELLHNDFFFLYKEHNFQIKTGKSETDSKRRPFFLENTMTLGQKL